MNCVTKLCNGWVNNQQIKENDQTFAQNKSILFIFDMKFFAIFEYV